MLQTLTLGSVNEAAPFSITVDPAVTHATTRSLRVAGMDPRTNRVVQHEYTLRAIGQNDYLDMFERLAQDFGTRPPGQRRGLSPQAVAAPLRPLLTRNIAPDIWYGYGDPAVLRVDDGGGAAYYAVVTSNDAPLCFPILHSRNLERWDVAGYAFEAGTKPTWATDSRAGGEYWAPEIHFVRGRFVLCFAAREPDESLSIGLAWSSRPGGPYVAAPEPLVRGGVIDPHIFVDDDGTTTLFWKEDTNGVWPSLLARLLAERPALVEPLFPAIADARTARFTATLWSWARSLRDMERFFVQQLLIDAVVADFAAFRGRLAGIAGQTNHPELRADVNAVLHAMRTVIYAQRLDTTTWRRCDEPTAVLQNDLGWEGHLVEGVWLTKQHGRYYLFYSGNDFSTAQYGIGVGVAHSPLGPYQKIAEPLVRSNADWWGPGHQSIAAGPDGRPWLFCHAYRAGHVGYKQFRALLAVPLAFGEGDLGVRIATAV